MLWCKVFFEADDFAVVHHSSGGRTSRPARESEEMNAPVHPTRFTSDGDRGGGPAEATTNAASQPKGSDHEHHQRRETD